MESRKGLYGEISESEVYNGSPSCGAFCSCMCSCGNCIAEESAPKAIDKSELVQSLIGIK